VSSVHRVRVFSRPRTTWSDNRPTIPAALAVAHIRTNLYTRLREVRNTYGYCIWRRHIAFDRFARRNFTALPVASPNDVTLLLSTLPRRSITVYRVNAGDARLPHNNDNIISGYRVRNSDSSRTLHTVLTGWNKVCEEKKKIYSSYVFLRRARRNNDDAGDWYEIQMGNRLATYLRRWYT
jgi:hypothetical protein